MKTKTRAKQILIILAIIAAILLIGLNGDLDHHEYIEANLRAEALGENY